MKQEPDRNASENMIRTGLYVQEPTTITVGSADPRSAKAFLYRYGESTATPAARRHDLQRGIYLIQSPVEMQVQIAGTATVLSMRSGKDPWPEPEARVVALEAGATAESIQQFFTTAVEI